MNLPREKTTELSEQLEAYVANQGFTENFKDIDLYTEDDYVKVRWDYFGASDSSKLLGVNPFSDDPYKELIYEKKNKIFDPEINKKAVVRMGKDLEDLILTKLTSLSLFNSNTNTLFKPNIMYTKGKGNLSVNFDGVLAMSENDVITYIPTEIKTISRWGRKHYDFTKAYINQKDGEWLLMFNEQFVPREKEELKNSTDFIEVAKKYGIPVYYFTQIQQQMLALNADYGYLVALDVEEWNIYIFKIYKNLPCHIKIEIKVEEAKKDLEE